LYGPAAAFCVEDLQVSWRTEWQQLQRSAVLNCWMAVVTTTTTVSSNRPMLQLLDDVTNVFSFGTTDMMNAVMNRIALRRVCARWLFRIICLSGDKVRDVTVIDGGWTVMQVNDNAVNSISVYIKLPNFPNHTSPVPQSIPRAL
jgi:hypothetical protein